MVSKASRLLAKGELVSFETESGMVDYNIKPLKNKELLEVIELGEKNDTRSMMLKMLYFSLIKDDPEITITDVENMDAPYLIQLLKIIQKVNRLEGLFDFQASGQNTPPVNLKPASNQELVTQLRQRLLEQRR